MVNRTISSTNLVGGGDGDLMVHDLRGGGGGGGNLPVVDDDSARAVFSIAPRSGEDAMERTARLGASASLLP